MATEVKYIDLFCGLGAFHTAFDRCSNSSSDPSVKYTCVFACDIDPDVRQIYEENYGLKPFGDINQLDVTKIPDFDILCAGIPCQPFSISGKKQGFDDKVKGQLFFRVLDVIDAKKPKTIIIENVKNLHTIHNGQTFETIMTELRHRGYCVSYSIIDSKYYNSPQSRKRIYIVCNKDREYVFRDIKNPIRPVSSIIDRSVETYFDYENKYRLEPCQGKNTKMLYKLINKATGKGGRQGERVYSIETCGPTICASSGGPGAKTGLYLINNRIRTLTVKEALQMFGFDTAFKYQSLGPNNKNTMLFFLGNSIVVTVLVEIIKDMKHLHGPAGLVGPTGHNGPVGPTGPDSHNGHVGHVGHVGPVGL